MDDLQTFVLGLLVGSLLGYMTGWIRGFDKANHG